MYFNLYFLCFPWHRHNEYPVGWYSANVFILVPAHIQFRWNWKVTYKKSEQTVLCLTTTDSKKLTKAFDKKRISTTGTASSFIHSEPQVPNVEVLYYLLNKIQDDPCTVIVSGVLTGDSRKLKTISRKKEHIIDKKRAWFCLDIDSFELPSDKDVINEPASCVKHFVNTSLPTEFRNT